MKLKKKNKELSKKLYHAEVKLKKKKNFKKGEKLLNLSQELIKKNTETIKFYKNI
jgi:hypothetical protein